MSINASKEQYWREHIDRWIASGTSQRVYCESNGIKPHLLGYWKRKFESPVVPANGKGNFVAVTLTPKTPSEGLCVILPSDIRVSGLPNIDSVVQLLRALP